MAERKQPHHNQKIREPTALIILTRAPISRLKNLACIVKKGDDFIVYDAKSGEDITRSVLTQIIFEQEGKKWGKAFCRFPSCASSSALW